MKNTGIFRIFVICFMVFCLGYLTTSCATTGSNKNIPTSNVFGVIEKDNKVDAAETKLILRTSFINSVNSYLIRYSPRLVTQNNDDYVKMTAKYEYQLDIELFITADGYEIVVSVAQNKYEYDRAQNICVKIAMGVNETFINHLNTESRNNRRTIFVPVPTSVPGVTVPVPITIPVPRLP